MNWRRLAYGAKKFRLMYIKALEKKFSRAFLVASCELREREWKAVMEFANGERNYAFAVRRTKRREECLFQAINGSEYWQARGSADWERRLAARDPETFSPLGAINFVLRKQVK